MSMAAGAAFAQNRLTLNSVQVFGTVDPAKVNDYTEYMAAVNLYDGLVDVAPDASIQPLIAESWEVAEDGKTFTFYLKKGVKFHDGSEVTAEDVVFSMRRVLALDQGPAYLWRDVLRSENVVAIDDYTVQFKLDKVFSPFLATLPVLFVANKDQVLANKAEGDYGEYGDYGQAWLTDHDAGSGAYTLGPWQRGSEIRFLKFDDYFRGWREGAYDEVRVVVTNEESTVRSLAQTGQLQITSQYQAQETYDALEKSPNFRIEQIPTATLFYLKVNTQKPPTDDPHVRRAIAYALDYEIIRDVIYPGAEPLGHLAPLFAVHDGELPPIRRDLEKAKAELAQSKYAGQDLKIVLMYVAGAAFEEQLGLLAQANLAEIGIDVELRPEPWNRMTELASSVEQTPHLNEVFFGPTYASPDSVFYTQYHSDAAGTWASMAWLNDPEVDRLIEEARATLDPEEQKEIYVQVQRRLFDLMPDIPLVIQTKKHAFHNSVAGYKFIPVQSFDYNFYNYYMEQ